MENLPLVTAIGGSGLLTALILAWAVAIYHRLARQRGRANASWARIDAQLRRRYDLVPELVEVVRLYSPHERGVLSEVMAARNGALSVARARIADRADAENVLTQMLARLFDLSASYPGLRGDQDFAQLRGELTDAADGIARAGHGYNRTVQHMSKTMYSIPSNLVAGIAGFHRPEYFRTTAELRGPLEVPHLPARS